MKAHFRQLSVPTPEGRQILERAKKYVDIKAAWAHLHRDTDDADAYTYAGNYLHYLLANNDPTKQ